MAREALALADELGNPSARAHALFALSVTTEDDDPVGASEALTECVKVSDEVGNQWTAGMSRVVLLRTQAKLSDRGQALERAGDLLQHWLDVGRLGAGLDHPAGRRCAARRAGPRRRRAHGRGCGRPRGRGLLSRRARVSSTRRSSTRPADALHPPRR